MAPAAGLGRGRVTLEPPWPLSGRALSPPRFAAIIGFKHSDVPRAASSSEASRGVIRRDGLRARDDFTLAGSPRAGVLYSDDTVMFRALACRAPRSRFSHCGGVRAPLAAHAGWHVVAMNVFLFDDKLAGRPTS